MKMSERAINAPQGVNARRIEATIIEKMPADTWLTPAGPAMGKGHQLSPLV